MVMLHQANAMEQSPFIKSIPLGFKICIFLDVNTKQFNNYLLFLRFFVNAFFLTTTFSCIYESDGIDQDTFSKTHDLLFLIILLTNAIFVVINKHLVCTLIEFILEPFGNFEPNSVHSKIVEDYNREVHMYGKVVTVFYVVSGTYWAVAPIVAMADSALKGDEGCAHLALGWAWRSESYWYMVPVYLASGLVTLLAISLTFPWYMIMVYTIIKIKFKIRLICADINAFSGLKGVSKEILESRETSSVKEKDLKRTSPQASTSPGIHRDRLQSMKKTIYSIEMDLQEYHKEKILQDGIKLYLANIVEQHVNVIKYVRLADKTFRLTVLVYVQLAVLVIALAIPKISLGKELIRADYIHRCIEGLGMMSLTVVFNYFGQILPDESETLRQAIYNCDWTDKPHSLRRGLLIVQIVATKPLRLTGGGIYALSMETLGNIASATYSYIGLLQSVNFGGQ